MDTRIDRVELAPGYTISRIIKGGWHLAGGHGQIEPHAAIEDMRAYVEAGITTFDCADIYTGVETLIGQFLQKYKDTFRSGTWPPVQIHTKYVPDYQSLSKLRKEDTTAIIDRSLQRLGVERLDLVQFHWWNYHIPGYVETAMHLQDLQRAGKIRHLGLTNFDGRHCQEILAAGVSIVAHQVQYSILDRRPVADLQATHQPRGIKYLCYGVLAGGFLTDRYLGVANPEPPFENRSLTKYRLIIEEFGSWDDFQWVLKQLRSMADKYKVGIAEIAAKFILHDPMAAGIIIGSRNQRHLKKIRKLESFQLDPEDLSKIREVISKRQGPSGPVFGLERDKTGKHGRIMKYDLNKQ